MSARRFGRGPSLDERRPRLGIVGCIPPAPTGPADFVAHMLPALTQYADVEVFTDDPASAEPNVTAFAGVHHLDERTRHGCDLLIYHVANNEYQAASVDAALAGPAGLLTLHDISQHHLVEYRYLGHGQPEKYRRVLRAAHGEAGAELADLRQYTTAFESERFLFDCLRPVLRRHRGAVVHSTFAAETVSRRDPDLPLFVMPHFSMPVPPGIARSELGLDESALLISHFGYVTRPKRPRLILEAFARLIDDGANAHLLFAGQAEQETGKELQKDIDRLHLRDRVSITGYLSEERMNSLVQAVDVVLSFRWPQVGESSGSVALALSAGRALVVQRMGAWAELPTDIVMDIPVGDTEVEVAGLHRALKRLEDPSHRRALGDAARQFAQTELSVDVYSRRLVRAARAVIERHPVPPSDARASRQRAVLAYTAAGRTGRQARGDPTRPGPVEDQPLDEAAHLWCALPAAGADERLLALDVPPELLQRLSDTWGYHVVTASSSAARMPFPAGSFAAAILFDPPADSGHLREALSEINRVLRGDGVVLVVDANQRFTGEDLGQYLLGGGFALGQLGAPECIRADGRTPLDGASTPVALAARKLSLPGLTPQVAFGESAAARSLPRLSEA